MTTPEPLWTPQSFVAAFEALEGAVTDRSEAIASTVVTMIRQYEAERAAHLARIAELEAELAATLTDLIEHRNVAGLRTAVETARLRELRGERKP